ncbi:MAG: hypothetical protein QGH99_02315 [Pseudomonadales bacterium]|jgi:hypothetical protein|nr:hypothetical protein [Pseudomonadales bacterium]MDP7316046.1 hypothetical protein [Pseudomonadales bacterium]MDP7575771.1 hypothetical protein [Pseudomonadales bacterium]
MDFSRLELIWPLVDEFQASVVADSYQENVFRIEAAETYFLKPRTLSTR